jgi:transmembrane sensor
VEHGHVSVHALREDLMLDLRPGQLLEIRDGQASRVRQGNAAALSAWREGRLVFESTPLQEALTSINAYRSMQTSTTDSRAAAMRLPGRFRASGFAGLVGVLPTILPLHSRHRVDGSVDPSPR